MQSITVFFIHSAQSFIICYLFDAKFYCFLSIPHKVLPFMWLQNYSVNNYLQCLVSSKGLMSDKHVTCPLLDVPPVGRRNSWARLSGFPYVSEVLRLRAPSGSQSVFRPSPGRSAGIFVPTLCFLNLFGAQPALIAHIAVPSGFRFEPESPVLSLWLSSLSCT